MGSKTTEFNWASYLREIPAVVLANQPAQLIGGPGMCAEIDESHLRSRKYSTGRILKAKQFGRLGAFVAKSGIVLLYLAREIQVPSFQFYKPMLLLGPSYIRTNGRPMGASTTFPKVIGIGVLTTRKIFYSPATLQSTLRPWKECGVVWRQHSRETTEEQKGAYFSKFTYEKKFNWYNLSTGETV